MNKSQYLAELSQLLVFMTRADREQTLIRYGALFDKAGEAREEELLAKLGTPTRSAIRLSRIYEPVLFTDAFMDELEAAYASGPAAAGPEPAQAPEETEPDVIEGLPDLDIPPLVMDDLSDLGFVPEAPAQAPEQAPENAPAAPAPEEAPAPAKKKAPKKSPAAPKASPAPKEAAPSKTTPPPKTGAPSKTASAPKASAAAKTASAPKANAPSEAAAAKPHGPKKPRKPKPVPPNAAAEAPRQDTPASRPLPRPIVPPEDDRTPAPAPTDVDRTVPLWLGVPLFILSVLLLALPLACLLLVLLPGLLLPGLILLLCTWLAAVGGLWCISYIADAVMLFGLAFLILGAALIVLWCGLRLDVALVKIYALACRTMTHLTLGKKVTRDA